MRRQNLILILALMVPIHLSAALAQAQGRLTQPQGSASVAGDFESTLKDSDFVFSGQVIRKSFAQSTPNDTDGASGAVPHTFITYKVEQVIKGRNAPPEVTLRFLGGDIPGRARIRVNVMPMIALGDRDIVFVRGNGFKACPIVRWGEGRIRLLPQGAFGEHSEQIGFDSHTHLRRGVSRPDLDSPRTDGLYRRRDSQVEHGGSIGSELPLSGGFRAADRESEIIQILRQAQSILEPQFPGRIFQDQDPKKPFSFKFPTPIAPK